MTHRVYIDGHVGTTGLRIRDWLAGREDLEVLTLPETDRNNPDARREALRQAEVAVLCLPDDAARDAAAWAEGSAEARRIVQSRSVLKPRVSSASLFPAESSACSFASRALVASAPAVAAPSTAACSFLEIVPGCASSAQPLPSTTSGAGCATAQWATPSSREAAPSSPA